MFKKIVLSAVLACAGVFAAAADMSSYSMAESSAAAEKISAAVEKQKYASEGASEDGVMTLKFEIKKTTLGIGDTGHLTEIVHFFNTTRKCSMIKIDDNWLVGSSYCFNFRTYEEEHSWTFDGSTTKEIKDLRIDGERITSIIKDSSVIYKNEKKGRAALPMYQKGDLILLYVGSNAKLKKKYASLPKSNLYIPLKAQDSAAELKGLKFYVSRKSVVWGVREKQEREIGEYCNGTKCIKLEFGFFHAEAMAGDPLFAVAPNKMEFIIAFNTGDYKQDEDQKRSRYFKELSEEDYKGLEKVISAKDPSGWARVKAKTAHTSQSFIIKK